MKSLVKLLSVAALTTVIGSAVHAATYNVDLTLDNTVSQFGTKTNALAVTVTGFVETSVTSGSFGVGGIADWSLTITDGNTTETVTSSDTGAMLRGNSQFEIIGDSLFGSVFQFGVYTAGSSSNHSAFLTFGAIGPAAVASGNTDRIIAESVDVENGQAVSGFRGFTAPLDGLALIGDLSVSQPSFLLVADQEDSPSPVPLPATAVLLLAGLGLLRGMRRRS